MDNFSENNPAEGNKKLILAVGVFSVLAVAIILVFVVIMIINNNKERQNQPALENAISEPKIETSSKPSLPSFNGENNGAANGNGQNDWEAQNVSFGDFYKMERENLRLSLPDYSLPQNIKVEVANYHDFSRKINIDSVLPSLNQNGFAIIDNPFPDQAKDFYQAYSVLKSGQVPVMLTSDFLIYYYQNILKKSFKDIEATVFYDSLWQTNKRLYAIAKERYETNLNKAGLANDLALEGSRRELAFFATAMAILSPLPEQIAADNSLSKNFSFSSSEASEYSFPMPSYLKDDVEKELNLIRRGKEVAKSPVLLYERDYKEFAVPAEYKNNARLNNFYLSSKWLSSVFPLLYRSEACPECLLDKDDWRLSMYSAFLIADDLSGSQDIQNRWAKIYKIMSFFRGLRGDLNYLHYRQALSELFGEEKKASEILSAQFTIDDNLSKLKEQLLKNDFSGVEGGLDKIATSTRKYLGLKMLVESYWPTEYILGQLTYPQVGDFKGSRLEAENLATACNLQKNPNFSRCLGMAFDVVNVIGQPSDGFGGAYFAANTNYENYESQADFLRRQFLAFTPLSWRNSNYWSTLDTVKKMMEAPDSQRPIFMRNEDWRKSELSSAVASWVNLQLPADTWGAYEKEAGRLGGDLGGEGAEEYSYIEPNLSLIRELKANLEMVLAMLKLLKVGEQENSVLSDLALAGKNLEEAERIVRKELNSEELSSNDYKFIAEFATSFSVKQEGAKVLEIVSAVSKNRMQEKLEGLKLKIVVYLKNGKRYFSAGPIFNYWENKKRGY